ncbi:VOC family protein [Microterricola pindariensis]|uniref:Glyoxalase n=1 Tax=Microterricola pindariensis TaxID=478010 RepID=A0ABX5B0R0_9MICO|nr:VOC family protein [Microterricola pindariensis]PPL20149.1 glyoxalase [Microterricola pindariensis]
MMDFKRSIGVLPASDLARARTYYKDMLGLEPEEDMDDEGGSLYSVGGSMFMLYQTSFAGTAKNTALTLETGDLAATMADMRGRGVAFEEYDMPGLKTENGVAELGGEHTAWFIDSEGNIIAIAQRS